MGVAPPAARRARARPEPGAGARRTPGVRPPGRTPSLWQERATWATTADQYDAAGRTLARLRSGYREAGEPAPAPPAATPTTRTVMIKEVLERDSAGLISKIKEYQITEPLPEGKPPATQ
jgi:hypothetical protein